ncbi:efflux RND transporter periplasmic adaptor subunit [Devosia submarina]|uniref:efflux RND transporter periplasmic adaptor subunit n=1 Tax=Devosia submarina TaxID=1173082 RepID=UPI001300A4F1|nr:efflux RND transporter periplasmic adaptor subunit [Devosia submarina]
MAFEGLAADRFAGEVEARYKATLSFRTFGRVVSRSVGVGDRVEPGQQIAQLDSTQQELAVRTAEANFASVQAQLNNLLAVEQRQQTLLEQNNISPAVFETARQARRAGESSLAQAQAQLNKAQEQLNYTTLRADNAGLVTEVWVEPGQTVAAGEAIVTGVQPEEREAVIAVIESEGSSLQVGTKFTITKQLDPDVSVPGTVREISPQADPTTRTVTVRIAMDDPAGMLRLGSTIIATRADVGRLDLVAPATSIFADGAMQALWVVDVATGSVAKRTVVAEKQESGDFIIREGLAEGDIVVTAGANSLKEGQKVLINEGHTN